MIINYDEIKSINTLDYSFVNVDYQRSFKLAQKDKVDYIYNTSALEGNLMTFVEVKTLLDGITVGGHKLSDEQMILNQNRSINLLFQLLEDKSFSINKETFLNLHKEVSKEEALEWGVFRKLQVNISGTDYIPPYYEDLEIIFNENIQRINEIKNPCAKAFTFFLIGAKNQFFYDGNKRTSRLMMNGILLANGYPLLNIKVRDQLEFNKMMIDFYNNDISIADGVSYLTNYYQKELNKLNEFTRVNINDFKIEQLIYKIKEINSKYNLLTMNEYNSKLFQKSENKEDLESKYIEFLNLELSSLKQNSSSINVNTDSEINNSLKP